jgi:hypothetical protein
MKARTSVIISTSLFSFRLTPTRQTTTRSIQRPLSAIGTSSTPFRPGTQRMHISRARLLATASVFSLAFLSEPLTFSPAALCQRRPSLRQQEQSAGLCLSFFVFFTHSHLHPQTNSRRKTGTSKSLSKNSARNSRTPRRTHSVSRASINVSQSSYPPPATQETSTRTSQSVSRTLWRRSRQSTRPTLLRLANTQDKSDLQQVLDTMKKEAERAKRLPRFGSPLTPNSGVGGEYLTPGVGGAGADDDVFSVHAASTHNCKRNDTSGLFAGEFGEFVDASPEPSPSRPFLASSHPSNEIEALQQHAQRQINTLKGTLQREKEMNRRKSFIGTPTVEEQGAAGEEDEDAFEDMELVNKAGAGALRSRRATPFRLGGKTRGKPGRSSGLTLVQMAPGSPSSEFAF